MRILLTGATGFIGRALTLRLQREGHQVVAWVRSESRARQALGADVDLVPTWEGDAPLRRALSVVDAVVNLAGEPVLGGRWTRARRQALVDSRVGLTGRLVDAMTAVQDGPRVLVSTSAVGFYGDRAEEILDEDSAHGEGFLADLCVGWEEAAQRATRSGVRVATIRIGVVLGAEGGALEKMLPLFRAGLGGRLSSGRQYLPWIHLDDLCEMFVAAVHDPRFSGAFNGTAPTPVTNAELTRTLARALGRRAFLPATAWVLRTLLGPGASAVLASQRARPQRALALGFQFQYPELAGAVEDIVAPDPTLSIERTDEHPDDDYLRARRPRYLLRQRTVVAAPIAEVFSFFSRAENLGAITPPSLDFILESSPPAQMEAGVEIDYTIKLGPVPLGWTTLITRWDEGRSFVDAQTKGPYRCWWHEHRFVADGDRTLMEDRVYYAPPFGWLGRVANRFFVAPMLKRIFGFRTSAIERRFSIASYEVRRAA